MSERSRPKTRSVATTALEVAGAVISSVGVGLALGVGLGLVALGGWLVLFGFLIGDDGGDE